MSANSAPPRRSPNTSLTRCATTTLVDFMLAHLLVDPCGVPVVQAGGVDDAQVLHVPVGPQVGRALEAQAQAVGEGQRDDLGMAAGAADGLAALLDQLLDGPLVDLGDALAMKSAQSRVRRPTRCSSSQRAISWVFFGPKLSVAIRACAPGAGREGSTQVSTRVKSK